MDYKLILDGDPFTVASYNIDESGGAVKTCLPIRMEIIRCTDGVGESNIICAARLDRHCSEGFAQHYPEILLGKSTEWKLVQFQIEDDRLCLRYHCSATDNEEDVFFSTYDTAITVLQLAFWVPHHDGRPATEYHVFMNCAQNKSSISTIIVKELLSSYERNLFSFTSTRPDEVSVTQYVDL